MMMLRTMPAGRSVLARALLMSLIGAAAILGLVGMHAFHPESHLVQHPTGPVSVAEAHHDRAATDPGHTALAADTQHGTQPGGTQSGGVQPGSVGCGDCGMGGGHVMVMVLCLLTLLVSAAVALWPPARPLLRPAVALRLLYQQLAARWPITVALSRPPSLQMLSISRT